MQDRIEIKNFSVLKNIDIKINNINIIIGDQAEGKSLVSKIIYFFSNISSYFVELIFSNFQQRRKEKILLEYFDKKLLEKFNELFPTYLLEQNGTFSIDYYYKKSKDSFSISSKKNVLKIKLPLVVKNAVKKIIIDLNEWFEGKNTQDSDLFKFKMIIKNIEELNLSNKSLFIPSGRSFFSYLENNIFFLADTLNLNSILKDFGSNIQNKKNDYKEFVQVNNNNLDEKITESIKEIIKGSYFRENNIDYIKNNDNKIVKLEDSSSGQQELLPLIWGLINTKILKNKYLYIIEEPEAHLYPATQKKITTLLSYIYNKSNKDINLLITTHSPYILTSLNNLIQANNTYKLKPEKENEISKVISKNTWINFEEISAYYLNDGFCEDILDYETNLIDTKFIDAISNEISKEFYELLDIGYDD